MSMITDSTSDSSIDLTELRRTLIIRGIMILFLTSLILFLPAGTLNYVEAWIWIAMWFIPALFVVRHFLKTDPNFLAHRMKVKEKEKEQRSIQQFGFLVFIISFLIPGLDKRYGWSSVPIEIVIVSDIMVFVSYLIVIRVFKENRYASRVIEVQSHQKVIETGPYSVMRHPMYVGSLLMFFFTPPALGSYWALIFSLLYLIMIVARIIGEEKILLKELNGYEEYTHKVRFRLIPGVW